MKPIHSFLRNICLAAVLTSGFASCQEEEAVVSPDAGVQQAEPASLTFTMTLPKATVHTRGYKDVDDKWENATGWTDMDKLIDGRMFYRITVFLIDANDRLVGFRDLYKGNDHLCEHNGFLGSDGKVDTGLEFGEKVRVSFLYDTPKHGEIEKLHRGKYRLMAVANYSKYATESDGGVIGHLRDGYQPNLTTFADLVKDYEENFIYNKGDVGIENFNATNYPGFFNAQLDAGDDRICPQSPQPLTLVTDVDLQPGDNYVEGELVRTYSRIRIEVENNASHTEKDLELTVADLTFSNNFAQRYAYLFSDPDDEERNYTDMSRGAMTITSTDAIVPFSADTKITELDAASATNVNEAVVFDAYILESKDETNNYTYTLDLKYAGDGEASFERYSTTAITSTSGVSNSYNNVSHYFLIKSYNNNYYLKAGDDNTIVTANNPTLTDALDESLVWELEYSANNQYYIKNAKTGNYVGIPNENEIPFLSSSKMDDTPAFTLSENTALLIYNTYYWGQNNGNVYGGDWPRRTSQQNRFRFQLYPVTETTAAPSVEETIILKTIDPETARVSEVTNIKRNDFVNVLVTVSYTPTADNGYFTFEVAPWVKKHGNYIEYE